jgi:lipopolysaccharide exporter
MRKLWNRLGAGVYSVKDLGTLGAGNVAALVFSLLAYPAIGRLYSDVQFGEFSVFQGFFFIFLRLTHFKYDDALLLVKTQAQFTQLLRALVIFTGAAVCVLVPVVGWFPGFGHAEQIKWWLVPTVLLGGWVQLGMLAMLREGEYARMSLAKAGDRLGFGALSIWLGKVQATSMGLVWGMVAGQLVVLGCVSRRLVHACCVGGSVRLTKALLWKHRGFPLYAFPGGLLEVFTRQLPVLVFGWWVGAGITGQFSMAYRLLALPEMLVGISVGQLFYKKIGQQISQKQALLPLVYATWKTQLVIGAVPFLLIWILGEEVFTFFLGQEWQQAGTFAQIMAPMFLIMFISTPTSGVFNALGKQGVGLLFSVLSLVLRTGSLVVGFNVWGIYVGVLLMVAMEIFMVLVYNFYLVSIIGQGKTR